jgi:hypothetical protein
VRAPNGRELGVGSILLGVGAGVAVVGFGMMITPRAGSSDTPSSTSTTSTTEDISHEYTSECDEHGNRVYIDAGPGWPQAIFVLPGDCKEGRT